VITLGNHTYRHREVWPYLDEQRYILRPANFMRTQPGHGTCVFERDGASLGVVNLSGNLFMQAATPAFTTVEEALREVAGHVVSLATAEDLPAHGQAVTARFAQEALSGEDQTREALTE
jgi:calcineurin-like phosphoesterase